MDKVVGWIFRRDVEFFLGMVALVMLLTCGSC